MNKAIAVIGMNYGDEGKGHIVNYLSDANTLNIRFNGGAQAAHTVFLSDGRNHVFRHFGSGSLRGARTLIANKVIVNPILFVGEFEQLCKDMKIREVFIDPRCRVSTHWDMLINAFTSNFKGRNNTCGIGINETIERSKFKQLKISMRDLQDKTDSQLKNMLKRIENEYVPYRIEEELKLPLDIFKTYCKDRIKDPSQTTESYLQTIKFMNQNCVVWPDDDLIDKFVAKDPGNRKIVFEGAQGMLLDQNRKEFFPFLTRSSTGIKNALHILRTVRTKFELDVCLVTRAYLNRHGDGPIMHQFHLPFERIEENTNVPNQYQGAMRYGYLDEKWYYEAISETELFFHDNKPKCIDRFDVGVAITCIDHVDFIRYVNKNRQLIEGSINDFENVGLESYGRTEKDIKNRRR